MNAEARATAAGYRLAQRSLDGELNRRARLAEVACPGNRHGENRDARADAEAVLVA